MSQKWKEEIYHYALKAYDLVLLTFDMFYTQKTRHHDEKYLITHITSISPQTRFLLPLDLELEDEGLKKWLQARMTFDNRTYMAKINQYLNRHRSDLQGALDISKALSLNDSYWVVRQDFRGSFAHYNLYENVFSRRMAKIAFLGKDIDGAALREKREFHQDELSSLLELSYLATPELTTSGMLPKAWRRKADGSIWLYKGGHLGGHPRGLEPYMEFYTCQIARTMGLDCVDYDLEEWDGVLASTCQLFTDKDVSYVPVGKIHHLHDLKDCIAYFDTLGSAFSRHIRTMLVFDSVVCNVDRHFSNFGVLRSSKTGQILAPAPAFDHGMSLLAFAGPKDLQSVDTLLHYLENLNNPYGISGVEIAACYMEDLQKEQLEKLLDFHFTPHPLYNLSSSILQMMEEAVQYRVRELLEIYEEKCRLLQEEPHLWPAP